MRVHLSPLSSQQPLQWNNACSVRAEAELPEGTNLGMVWGKVDPHKKEIPVVNMFQAFLSNIST